MHHEEVEIFMTYRINPSPPPKPAFPTPIPPRLQGKVRFKVTES